MRNLPPLFGRWATVFTRCRDRVRADVLKRLFDAALDAPDRKRARADAAIVSRWLDFPAAAFRRRGRASRPDGSSFCGAVNVAGLDPETITPHVMRHAAITKLVQAGVDLPIVQRISGHKRLTMVLRCLHVHDRHIDQAVQAIGRTILKRPVDGSANTITQELHTAPIAALPGGRPQGESAYKAIT